MAEVEVKINGRFYRIACDDGQENHLIGLADYVGDRIDTLAASVGQVGDARLLVMASILIADELSELKSGQSDAEPETDDQLAEIEDALADRLDSIAIRLETIASGLDA